MPVSFKWYHAAILAGGAVGVGGLICYLLRDEPEEKNAKPETPSAERIDVQKVTKEQVLVILDQVIASQDKMKTVMKELTKELIHTNYTFDELYNRVKAVQPVDPLEVTGLTMVEFDQLLERFQKDPKIREAVGKILGSSGPMSFTPKTNSLKPKKIVQIHSQMLKYLREIVEQYQQNPKREEYDVKTVTIAAQTMVGARIEKEFDLTSEEIEAAVLLHHQTLQNDPGFAQINIQMQSTMSELLSSGFNSSFME